MFRSLQTFLRSIFLIGALTNTTAFADHQVQLTLVPNDRDSGDLFGTSVDIDGSLAAVGAHFWEPDSGGVSNQGAVYIFEQSSSGVWNETALITTDGISGFTPNNLDNFGVDLSLDGDTLVVGAFKADIAGNSDSGAAFVFRRSSPGNWSHVTTLFPSDSASGDRFGQHVALDGNTIVVGTIEKNGQQGAAYIFERPSETSNQWSETAQLTLQQSNLISPQFGHGVGVYGDTIAVSTSGQHSNGKVYIYERISGNWNTSFPLIVEGSTVGTETGDSFGFSLSLDENSLAIGAVGDDEGGGNAGAVYVFGRNFDASNPEVELADNWGLIKKVINPDSPNQASFFDEFGNRVAISENILLVGSLNDDDFGTSSGSAVEFGRNVGGVNKWGFVHEHHAPPLDQADWINYGTDVSIYAGSFLIGAQHAFSTQGLGGSAYITESYLIANPVSAISFYRGQDPVAQLHMTDLAGNDLKKISTSDKPETVHSWSPDGSRLLFTRLNAPPFNSSEILIAEVDEEGNILSEINLTQDPANDHSAAWMPGGNSIVFASNRQDNNYELYVMDVSDLSSVPSLPITRITNTTANELHPAVSTDGKIAVTQDENTLVFFEKTDGIYSVSQPLHSSGGVFTPSWSPDGVFLVFAAGSFPGGTFNNDLEIYKIDSSLPGTAVTISPGPGHGPSWGPNNDQVLYVANNNGSPGPITKLNIEAETAETTGQIGNLPQWRPTITAVNSELVANYPFSGDASDQSGNGNDLSVSGATLAEDRFGNLDSAFYFDGVDDFMSAGFDTSDDDTFTWTFWLRDLSTTPSIRRWLSTNNTNAASDTVIIRENFAGSGGPLELLVGTGDAHGALAKGQWTQYAVVSDGAGMSVYVNATLAASNPTLAADPEPGLYVGGFFDGAPTRPEYFQGYIDDIKLFSRALTQSELAALYEDGAPPPNVLPVISGPESVTQYEGLEVSQNYIIEDQDGTISQIEVVGDLPEGIEFSTSFGELGQLLIQGKPASGSAGSYPVTVLAIDNDGGEDELSVIVEINPYPEIWISQVNGPAVITGVEGEHLSESVGETQINKFIIIDPFGVQLQEPIEPKILGLPFNASLNLVNFVSDDNSIVWEYELNWFPTYDQGGQSYTAIVSVANFSGVVTELPVVIHIGDITVSDAIIQLEDTFYDIDLEEFKGKKENQKQAKRQIIERGILKIGEYWGEDKFSKALDEILKVVKHIDNGFLKFNNSNDKMESGEAQQELLFQLIETGKTITQELRNDGVSTPPIVLVHGFISSPETWREFILRSGLTFGGTVQVEREVGQSQIEVSSDWIDLPSTPNGFEIYAVGLSDGDGLWDDQGLVNQGDMLSVAVDQILERSGASEVVLIGHSMGGLTIKSFLTHWEGEAKVAGYMTVGTPHRGARLNPSIPVDALCFIVEIFGNMEQRMACEARDSRNSIAAQEIDFSLDPNSPINKLNEAMPYDVDFRFALATRKSEQTGFTGDPQIFYDYYPVGLNSGDCDSEVLDYFLESFTLPLNERWGFFSDNVVNIFSQLNLWCSEVTYVEDEFHLLTAPPNDFSIEHKEQTSNKLVVDRLMIEYWENAIP